MDENMNIQKTLRSHNFPQEHLPRMKFYICSQRYATTCGELQLVVKSHPDKISFNNRTYTLSFWVLADHTTNVFVATSTILELNDVSIYSYINMILFVSGGSAGSIMWRFPFNASHSYLRSRRNKNILRLFRNRQFFMLVSTKFSTVICFCNIQSQFSSNGRKSFRNFAIINIWSWWTIEPVKIATCWSHSVWIYSSDQHFMLHAFSDSLDDDVLWINNGCCWLKYEWAWRKFKNQQNLRMKIQI